MKCSKSSSLGIVEAEICNAAELGSGGQSGGFPTEAGVFQVCSEATSGWTMYFCQIINDASVVLRDLIQQFLLYYLVAENFHCYQELTFILSNSYDTVLAIEAVLLTTVAVSYDTLLTVGT
ncbi:hypothetical protein VPH35_020880 [Triticum aestivum]